MRWVKDEIDHWCESWAHQRRKMLGLSELQPRDRIGQMRSTLGAVKEEREGASQGAIKQNFPEVYIGPPPNFPLLVNRAWLSMDQRWRPVIEVHYVYLKGADGQSIKVKEKCAAIDLSTRLYWLYLTFGKNYIHSFVMLSTESEVPDIICTQKTPVFMG